jgi:hypothetical protein
MVDKKAVGEEFPCPSYDCSIYLFPVTMLKHLTNLFFSGCPDNTVRQVLCPVGR